MAEVAVVTDSTCYLPTALVDSLDITVVSASYDLGHGAVRESEFDGDFERFYAELDLSKTGATVSPPTVEDFIAVFDRLLTRHSAVVAVLISSSLAEICSHVQRAVARMEAEGRGGERVWVIDSSRSAGDLGFQVIAAARAAAAGRDRSGVAEATRAPRLETRSYLLLDTLEYLHRGGRIGGAAAWVGSVLDLKPILSLQSEFQAVERVRTRRRGVERLVALMRQYRASAGADHWYVQHTGMDEDVRRLTDRLAEMFDTEPDFVSEMGPGAAMHLGPRALLAGAVPGTAFDGDTAQSR